MFEFIQLTLLFLRLYKDWTVTVDVCLDLVPD